MPNEEKRGRSLMIKRNLAMVEIGSLSLLVRSLRRLRVRVPSPTSYRHLSCILKYLVPKETIIYQLS